MRRRFGVLDSGFYLRTFSVLFCGNAREIGHGGCELVLQLFGRGLVEGGTLDECFVVFGLGGVFVGLGFILDEVLCLARLGGIFTITLC